MPNMPQTYTARAFRIWHAGKVRDKPEYLRSCQPAVGRQQVGVGGRLGDCFVFLAGRAQPLASKIVMRVHRRRRARLSCQKVHTPAVISACTQTVPNEPPQAGKVSHVSPNPLRQRLRFENILHQATQVRIVRLLTKKAGLISTASPRMTIRIHQRDVMTNPNPLRVDRGCFAASSLRAICNKATSQSLLLTITKYCSITR
jgi:hypothetical protein